MSLLCVCIIAVLVNFVVIVLEFAKKIPLFLGDWTKFVKN